MIDLAEGWSAAIPFTLYYTPPGGDLTVLDLTGMTVTLRLLNRAGAAVSTSGKVAVVSATDGTVTFTPGAEDLKAASAPYRARFAVTDTGGKTLYIPSGKDGDEWRIGL